MDNDLFSIGDVARASGLSVSALRFYDRVGVLSPVMVDSNTAYRWYSPAQLRSAELIAELRRIGLPLPEVTTVLAHHGDARVLRDVLDEHIVRLEQGLAAAKTVIGKIEQQWDADTGAQSHRFSVECHELRRALSSVRFAVGSDEESPHLHGILMQVRQGQLQLTSTDRHRAAFYALDICSDSQDFKFVLAQSGLDALLNLLQEDGTACLSKTSELTISVREKTINLPLLDTDFPDLTEKVQSSSRAVSATVKRQWFRSVLGKYSTVERRLLEIDPSGQLLVRLDNGAPDDDALLLNARFLSDALESAVGEILSLEVNGPVAPLAIRSIDNPHSFSVIMPILRDKQ